MRKIFTLIFLILVVDCFSQQHISWDDFKDYYINNIPYQDKKNAIEELSRLEDIHVSPLNINNISAFDLEQLPFLNDSQIAELLNYKKHNKPIYSLSELMLLYNFDYRVRQMLSLFLYCGDLPNGSIPLKEKLLGGRQQILSIIKIPLYKRVGNSEATAPLSSDDNKHYLGDSWAQSIRYSYDWEKRIRYGFTLDKDANEPFASRYNSFYDAFSFYFAYREENIPISFVLGDYKVNFGQGLVVGNNFAFWKQNYVFSQHLNSNNILPHSSTSESNYFRGIAAKYNWHKFSFSSFLSSKYIDATDRDDGTISSLKNDGYHRTLKELSRKHNLKEMVVGAHLGYKNYFCNIGLTAVHLKYNKPFIYSKAIYRRYYFTGKSNFNAGLHYSFSYHRFLLIGETAVDDKIHCSFVNAFKYCDIGLFQISLAHRYFSYKYIAPLAQAMGEGSHVNNEQGLLLSLMVSSIRKVQLSSYIDFFYFAWPTFLAAKASNGCEFSSQLVWSPRRSWTHNIQYRFKKREKNIPNSNLKKMGVEFTHQLKCQTKYKFNDCFSMQYSIAFKIKTSVLRDISRGFVFALRGNVKMNKIKGSVFAAFFRTDDYSSALYLYEPGFRYSYSLGSYFYHGMKFNTLINWSFNNKLSLAFQYTLVYYNNRSYISSGAQKILSNYKNDLSFQICYKF